MGAVDCWCRNCGQHLFPIDYDRRIVCRMLCHHERDGSHGRDYIYGFLRFGKHIPSVSSSYCFRLAGSLGQCPFFHERTSTQVSATPSLRNMVRAESVHDHCRLVALHPSHSGRCVPSMCRRTKIHVGKHLDGLRRHQHLDIRHSLLDRRHHQLAAIPLCQAPSPTTGKNTVKMKNRTEGMVMPVIRRSLPESFIATA